MLPTNLCDFLRMRYLHLDLGVSIYTRWHATATLQH